MNVKDVYQDSAVSPSSKKPELSEKDRQTMANVEEVLGMPGFTVLNGLMNEYIEHYTRRAIDLSADDKTIRYAQGVVNGIVEVRAAFVRLSKEEGYVG